MQSPWWHRGVGHVESALAKDIQKIENQIFDSVVDFFTRGQEVIPIAASVSGIENATDRGLAVRVEEREWTVEVFAFGFELQTPIAFEPITTRVLFVSALSQGYYLRNF